MLDAHSSSSWPGSTKLMVEAQLLLLEALRGQFDAAQRRAPRVWALAERFPHPCDRVALAEFAFSQDDPPPPGRPSA